MNPDDKFTVIVRDVPYKLSRSQIEFDSPNYFTACFLGDFQESQTRTLEISRDPDLFGIIVDYLCGYTVLPLKESIIPSRMSLETALVNLRADAEFYQLDGLVQACDDQISPMNPLSKREYMIITGITTVNRSYGKLSVTKSHVHQ